MARDKLTRFVAGRVMNESELETESFRSAADILSNRQQVCPFTRRRLAMVHGIKLAHSQFLHSRTLNQVRTAAMVNPFDLKAALLAKHAQHVVLMHFPIALFISAVAFDVLAQWTKARSLADPAYYNLLAAAISTLPALGTGILAWQLQLESQKLKGILLMHLVFACLSTAMIWLVWWVHFRARRCTKSLPNYRLALEFLGIGIVAITGHLGGFLSGVNGPG
jgi:uncharacterized membrane protein